MNSVEFLSCLDVLGTMFEDFAASANLRQHLQGEMLKSNRSLLSKKSTY